MKAVRHTEFPKDRQNMLRWAITLEVLTIAHVSTVGVLMFLVMGSSQAMKSEWIEKLLSLVPPLAFLLALPLCNRPPNERFPYGYHRSMALAFLSAALGLFAMGGYLLIEALLKLIRQERPTIGTVELFGAPIWLGWLMLPVLLYGAGPAILLGRAKITAARVLHNKTLYADASMNQADWLTNLAASIGVMGIAVGWWWLDAAAAAAISLDILHDGFKNVRGASADLMDRAPQSVDHRAAEGLPARIATELKKLPWVRDAEVRLRDNGHVFFGEAFVCPVDQHHPLARIEEAVAKAYAADWRIQELVVQLVKSAEGQKEDRSEA